MAVQQDAVASVDRHTWIACDGVERNVSIGTFDFSGYGVCALITVRSLVLIVCSKCSGLSRTDHLDDLAVVVAGSLSFMFMPGMATKYQTTTPVATSAASPSTTIRPRLEEGRSSSWLGTELGSWVTVCASISPLASHAGALVQTARSDVTGPTR